MTCIYSQNQECLWLEFSNMRLFLEDITKINCTSKKLLISSSKIYSNLALSSNLLQEVSLSQKKRILRGTTLKCSIFSLTQTEVRMRSSRWIKANKRQRLASYKMKKCDSARKQTVILTRASTSLRIEFRMKRYIKFHQKRKSLSLKRNILRSPKDFLKKILYR